MSRAGERYRVAMRILWSRRLREAHGDRAAALFVQLHADASLQGRSTVLALWARSLVGLISTRWAVRGRRAFLATRAGKASVGVDLLRDVGAGFRQISHRPLVTSVVITTLALGIGVNAAAFTVYRAVELSALPMKEPERLAVVRMDNPVRELSGWWWSYPNIGDLRASSGEFEAIGVYGGYAANLLGPDGPQRVSGARVSSGFLATLGIEPILGREFTADEDRLGGPAVALIGYRLWEQQFAARPDVIGQAVTLDSVPHTVVGVLPPTPRVLDRLLWLARTGVAPTADLFVPLDPEAATRRRSTSGYGVIGRLAAHATLASAHEEARTLMARLQEEYAGDFCCDWNGRVTSLHEFIVGDTGRALTLVVLVAASVLALVCVNLGALLSVRASERGREWAVRRSIGAGPARLAQQVLVESTVLGALGGVLGLGLGASLLRALVSMAPDNLPRLDEIALDGSTVVFTLAGAVIASTAFGAVPALLAARRDPVEVLRVGPVGLSRRGASVLRGLVGLEVALALVLVTSSTLLALSFRNLAAQDPGYRVEGVMTAEVRLPDAEYPDDTAAGNLHRALRDRLLNSTGIGSVAMASFTYPGGPWTRMGVDGRTDQTGKPLFISVPALAVTPEFFDTLEVPLVAGRGITGSDDMSAIGAVVVSEAMAAMAWPDEAPASIIGKRLVLGSWRPFMRGGGAMPAQAHEVVGVVGNVRELGSKTRETLPYVYQPLAQDPWLSVRVFLHGKGAAADVVEPVRAALAEIDPTLPLFDIESLASKAARGSSRERFVALLVGGFAVLAVVLAAVGTYGTVAYSVALRTREIGLRKALGATPSGVSRALLRTGLIAPLAGAAVGLGAFALVSPALATLLYEITPLEAGVVIPAGLGQVLVAALATWIPARRASRVDPLLALRD